MVKKIGLLVCVFLSTSVWAATPPASLPDPMTCGKAFPNGIVIQHHGKSFIAKHETYTLSLQFNKPGAFTYSSNWGIDVKSETIDGTTLSDQYQTGMLQKLLFLTDTKYSCTKDPGACGSSLNDSLERLDAADDNLIAAQPQQVAADHAAIACANSIALSMMAGATQIMATRTAFAPGQTYTPEALSAPEAASTLAEIQAYDADENAQAAQSYAIASGTAAAVSAAAAANTSTYSAAPSDSDDN